MSFLFFGKQPVVEAPQTVDSILSEFHSTLDKLANHKIRQEAAVVAAQKAIESAEARKVHALAEAARANEVHSKISDLIGLTNHTTTGV